MMWWGNGFGPGWMAFGGLMMLLFWAALIVVAVLAVRAFSGSRPPAGASPSTGQTALDIAKERYARGEITREEYDRLRQDLTG